MLEFIDLTYVGVQVLGFDLPNQASSLFTSLFSSDGIHREIINKLK
jgi:hypothetical protein